MAPVSEQPHVPTLVGWREWVALPALHVDWIKAKIDTGAKTSSIHAFDVETLERDGAQWARFSIHPWQASDAEPVVCECPVVDRRIVRSSSGHAEERYAVAMELTLVGRTIPAEVTLSSRDEMGFRMLIGREALAQGFHVDPGASYLGGRPKRSVRRRNWGR